MKDKMLKICYKIQYFKIMKIKVKYNNEQYMKFKSNQKTLILYKIIKNPYFLEIKILKVLMIQKMKKKFKNVTVVKQTKLLAV